MKHLQKLPADAQQYIDALLASHLANRDLLHVLYEMGYVEGGLQALKEVRESLTQ